MKLFKILLTFTFLLLLTSSLISTANVRIKKGPKVLPAQASKGGDFKNGLAYKYSLGLLLQIGGDPKELDDCLPKDWKDTPEKDFKASEKSLIDAKEMFMQIHGTLGVSIDIACKFKPNIKDFLKKKSGVGRFRRLHIELAKVKSKVNPFDFISEKIKPFYNKFKPIISNALVTKTFDLLKCLKKAKDIKAIHNFKAIADKAITDLPNFIDVIVETLCDWKLLKEAFIFFKNASTATDGLAKANKYGEFMGKLILNMGKLSADK